MKKIIILISIFFIVGCTTVEEENNGEFNIMATQIDCLSMKEKLVEGAILLDVRDKSEFKVGSLEYAKNIPVDTIEDTIEDEVSDKDTPIIVFCKSGTRSKKATQKLIDMGYTHVFDLGSINNCNV